MALNQVGLERLNTATTKKIGTNKNLIINGAMQVAQRGTSSTDQLYSTVDRIRAARNSVDENPTFAQVDVASGTTPYTSGFRKAFKITNGNQTSGAGSSDVIAFTYRIEAQDIANSGWNYTSASSFITLSYWVRSSVAQNFFGRLFTSDGTTKNFPFQTGSLSANTWTKITKTIPGHADLQFDNDNGRGLDIDFIAFRGTDQTASGVTLDQWANLDNTARTPDQTTTWYTTNDATLEFTGLQLEVGSVATDFEHKSFAEELRLCYRYYYHTGENSTDTEYYDDGGGFGMAESTTKVMCGIRHPVEMRSTPTITLFDSTDGSGVVTQKGHTHGIVAVANQSGAIGFQRVSHSGGGTQFQLDGTKPVSFGYRAEAEL